MDDKIIRCIKRFVLMILIIIILFPIFAHALIIDNYTAGWKLDASTLDASGIHQVDNLNFSNATLLNGSGMVFVTNGTCKIDECYLFIGTGNQQNRINIPHTSALETLNTLQTGTITFWAKTETNYAGAFFGQANGATWVSPYASLSLGANSSLGESGSAGDFYVANNSAQTQYVAYNQPTKNVWHFYAFTFNFTDNNMSIYIDGVIVNSSAMQYRKSQSTWNWSIGALRWDVGPSQFGSSYNGYMDDVNIWSRELNELEIAKIYTKNMTYPFEEPITNFTYNITVIQEPPDINSSTLYLNVTVKLNSSNSNMSNLTNAYVTYYSKIFTSLNNGCSVFYQSVCIQNSSNFTFRNMTQINNSYYTLIVSDNEIFPAYYPFNYTKINTIQGFNYTAYNNNNIKFKILNFSTLSNYTFLTVEMDAINMSSLTASMIVYYCNSSYTTGNPLLSADCEVISIYLPQGWSHMHNQSRHGVIQFQVINITKTQTSYIVFVSPNILSANGWRFRYINDTSYNNDSFQIGNFNSWSNTSNIYDIHLHQYLPTDFYESFAKFNDDTGGFKQSNTTRDYYNITQYLPTIPLILTPNCSQKFTKDITGTYNNSINFSWTRSSDANNDSITYYMNFTDGLLTYNACNVSNPVTSCIGKYGTTQLNAGNYSMIISACDFVSCASSDSSCKFQVCQNSWTRSVQPCITNVMLVTYTDLNGCPDAYNIPADNGTYETCNSIVYNQTVFTDDILILIILTIFLVISLISAIFVHEGFFGMCALIIGFMLATFIYYDYPDVILIACAIMILLFGIMWIVVHKMRR